MNYLEISKEQLLCSSYSRLRLLLNIVLLLRIVLKAWGVMVVMMHMLFMRVATSMMNGWVLMVTETTVSILHLIGSWCRKISLLIKLLLLEALHWILLLFLLLNLLLGLYQVTDREKYRLKFFFLCFEKQQKIIEKKWREIKMINKQSKAPFTRWFMTLEF